MTMYNLTCKPFRKVLCSVSASLALLGVTPVMAEELSAMSPFEGLSPVSDQELSVERGRENVNIEDVVLQLSEANSNAVVTDNVLNSQSTGDNMVAAGAFDGAAGVVFAVQNSGNHVVIQNTTLINVTMNP